MARPMLCVTTEVPMRILKLELAGMIAAGALCVGTTQSAFAQTAPTSDPVETCDPDTANCPPSDTSTGTTGSTSTTGTTTTTTTTDTDTDADIDTDRGSMPSSQTNVEVNTAPPPPPPPQPAPTTEYYSEPYVAAPSRNWVQSVGLGFSAGGGVDDFASDTMRATTGVGGGWNVRATLGTKTFLALEGSYIGSAQNIDALGLDNDALLIGNGVQGAGRLNLLTGLPVQPFVYAGVAWRRYDITDSNINTSNIDGEDDVIEFPGGIGVSGYLYGMMADVRGEYRIATDEDLAPSRSNTGDATLDRWAVTGSLGFAY